MKQHTSLYSLFKRAFTVPISYLADRTIMTKSTHLKERQTCADQQIAEEDVAHHQKEQPTELTKEHDTLTIRHKKNSPKHKSK